MKDFSEFIVIIYKTTENFMKYVFLFLVNFFISNLYANDCKEVQSRAQEYLNKVNELFKTNFLLDFEDDDVAANTITGIVSWGCDSIVMRPFLKDPTCIYPILGHEIAHLLISDSVIPAADNSYLDMYQLVKKTYVYLLQSVTGNYNEDDLYQAFHLNMDGMSAKLMKQFGIEKKDIGRCNNLEIKDFIAPNGYINRTNQPYPADKTQAAIDMAKYQIAHMEKAYDEGFDSWSNFANTNLVCYHNLKHICDQKLLLDSVLCQKANETSDAAIQEIIKVNLTESTNINPENLVTIILSTQEHVARQSCQFPDSEQMNKKLLEHDVYLKILRKILE